MTDTPPGWRIDLNADLGEDPHGVERDAALLGIVTSANIACGGHAGDAGTMRVAVLAAAARGVAVGAHPSYPDRAGFGRVEMEIGEAELERSLREQLGALAGVARACGVRVAHLKPHGGLYHAAMRRPEIARLIARVAGECSVDGGSVALVGQAGRPGIGVWRELGAVVLEEAFADRRYEADGTLRSRTKPGAVLGSASEAAEQAVRIATGRGVVVEGGSVALRADTICLHSDTPGAVEIARAVREALEGVGVRVERAG